MTESEGISNAYKLKARKPGEADPDVVIGYFKIPKQHRVEVLALSGDPGCSIALSSSGATRDSQLGLTTIGLAAGKGFETKQELETLLGA